MSTEYLSLLATKLKVQYVKVAVAYLLSPMPCHRFAHFTEKHWLEAVKL